MSHRRVRASRHKVASNAHHVSHVSRRQTTARSASRNRKASHAKAEKAVDADGAVGVAATVRAGNNAAKPSLV